MDRRRIVSWIVLAISLVLLGTLLVGKINKTLYERAEVRVPAYPNAANLRTASEPYGPPGAGIRMRTTFETTDSPASVIDFYRARMTVRGLQHWDYWPGLDNLGLFNRDGCPSHQLTLQPTQLGARSTTVDISHAVITRC